MAVVNVGMVAEGKSRDARAEVNEADAVQERFALGRREPEVSSSSDVIAQVSDLMSENRWVGVGSRPGKRGETSAAAKPRPTNPGR